MTWPDRMNRKSVFTFSLLYFSISRVSCKKPDSFSVCGQTAAGLDQPWLQSVHGKQLLFFFLAETKQNKTTPLSWLQIWSLRRTCWCCEVKFKKNAISIRKFKVSTDKNISKYINNITICNIILSVVKWARWLHTVVNSDADVQSKQWSLTAVIQSEWCHRWVWDSGVNWRILWPGPVTHGFDHHTCCYGDGILIICLCCESPPHPSRPLPRGSEESQALFIKRSILK